MIFKLFENSKLQSSSTALLDSESNSECTRNKNEWLEYLRRTILLRLWQEMALFP